MSLKKKILIGILAFILVGFVKSRGRMKTQASGYIN